MHTKKQIVEKIEELRSVSPSGASSLFATLLEAINGYFERGEEFERLIRKTILRVTSEAFSRNIEVEFPERLPPLRTDFPKGYSNVAEIFNGDIFEEIMTVDVSAFRAAFQSHTESGDSGSSTVVWTNSYITSWLEGINSTKEEEVGALETIGEFCIDCNEERGLALIFEELGNIQQDWAGDKRNLGRVIYIERGYDWVITNFNLNVFEPHYLPELRR